MPTTQHPGILREGEDDMIDDLAFTPRGAVLVGDIQRVTAEQPDSEHELFHVSAH